MSTDQPTRPSTWYQRATRLLDYDYSSAGGYFVTIAVRKHACVLGQVHDGEMQLSAYGQIATDAWMWLERQYGYVELDTWVLMPNHLHGTIMIVDRSGSSRGAATPKPVGQLVGAFKTVSTKRINRLRGMCGIPFWQRSFYDHVIRDEADLERIREYIAGNPARWDEDAENPDKIRI